MGLKYTSRGLYFLFHFIFRPRTYIVEDQLGPEVIHIYDVKNKGPATIKEAEVFIMWPSFTKDEGDERHLLYLLGVSKVPEELGKV